jgi:erythrocyte band 7 integral membrane protein
MIMNVNPISKVLNIFTVINKSESGIRLSLGKLKSHGIRAPGFHFRMPMYHKMYRVDLRERVDTVSRQTLISKDNVTFYVDGCVQWRIANVESAFFNVANIHESIIEIAKIEMRNLLSSIDINELLHRRGEMSTIILENMKHIEERWGVRMSRVEIMDIQFDETMTRAMAVKAEADRNAEAKIINAKADVETAKQYKEASEIYLDNPVSMRLREYQLWQSVSRNPATTLFVVPSGIVDYLGSFNFPKGK